MMYRIWFLVVFLVSACTSGAIPHRAERNLIEITRFPPMKVFAAHNTIAPSRPNAEIARDFLDLSFRMESGRSLDVMSRFEGPITLRVLGTPPASLAPDLDALLHRLRREANLDIRQIRSGPANITIETLSQAQMHRIVPSAACFVVPRVSSWKEFRANRRNSRTDWTTLTRRETVAIFIPNDVSPQEIRDCLHEEVAQAVGPLNDLYRLPDSVFNDDNLRTVLTGFDMLILRLYNAPEMRSGMSRAEAARVLPSLLRKLNPRGNFAAETLPEPTPRAWINAIETALGPSSDVSTRRRAADRAVDIARARHWNDSRLGFSLFTQSRLLAASAPNRALESLAEARALFMAHPETRYHAAHASTHLAIFSLSAGQVYAAIALVDDNLAYAEQAENAALLSTLLMIKAEALDTLGQVIAADRIRTEALGWARYGFGSTDEVRRRINEIAALSPSRPRGLR